jgi:hypothetical protein
MSAEDNQATESEMFPLTEDPLGDVIYTFVGVWIAMSINLPIENKEQVIATIENMSEMLNRIKNHMSNDPDQFNRDLLHCLRRAMAPRLWEINSLK